MHVPNAHATPMAGNFMQYVVIASLVLLALIAPAVAETPAETLKRMQEHVRQRQYAEAIASADAALKDEALPPADKARLLKLAAEATISLGRDHAPDAIERYEQIFADPDIPTAARLDALRAIADVQVDQLAGQYLHEMDLSAAHETLARGPALPQLSPHDRATALSNVARLLDRQQRGEEARGVYRQILDLEVSDSLKKQTQQSIANSFIQDGRADEAVAIYRDNGLDLIEAYRLIGDNPKRHEACVQVLANADATEAVRWSAFSRMPCWDWRTRDFAAIRQACETYLPGFMESDANRALILRRAVLELSDGDPAFAAWAAPILMQAPRLSDADYNKAYIVWIDALASQKDKPAAIAAAEAMSKDQRIATENRLAARLMAAALAGQNEVRPILDDSGDLPPTARAQALLQAARTALRTGDHTTARALHAVYQSLLANPERASITCRFMDAAPFDIGSWLASPLRRDPAATAALDRPYGSNLEFLLLTDSAVTGRNVGAADGPADDHKTDFHIASDAQGIHLLLFAHDSRTADVLNGSAASGSYEIYLAPGDRQAYYTFLIELPDGRVDPQGFITMYPNARFRLPSIEQGTMRAQTRAVEGGFATYLFLSWELFHDRLPADGDRWQFEAIRWTRSGGFTFGGSQSVHNRSSWGDIVFAGMNDEHLDRIRRHVIPRAAEKYRAARRVTGAAGQWDDRDLGDPTFFKTKVQPLLDRLDAYAAMLENELTAEQVAEIYRHAVPGWMETGHLVDALRAEYLAERHFSN